MARTEQKESEVQSAICECLAARGAFFIRLNNIPAFFIDRRGQKQFRPLRKPARRGMADILVVKLGLTLLIEAKSEAGRLFPDQHDFARAVVLAGATYFVARSIDDVHKQGL
jgi:hypothetical protein